MIAAGMPKNIFKKTKKGDRLIKNRNQRINYEENNENSHK